MGTYEPTRFNYSRRIRHWTGDCARLRRPGAKVFVCDIDPKALETLAQEIPGVKTVVCDVSKRQDIEHMVEAAIDALGALDVLVNNAGIPGSATPVEKSNPDDWEKVVQVNLIGTFNVTRVAIPEKILGRGDHHYVVWGGRFGYANRTPYSATK